MVDLILNCKSVLDFEIETTKLVGGHTWSIGERREIKFRIAKRIPSFEESVKLVAVVQFVVLSRTSDHESQNCPKTKPNSRIEPNGETHIERTYTHTNYWFFISLCLCQYWSGLVCAVGQCQESILESDGWAVAEGPGDRSPLSNLYTLGNRIRCSKDNP